MSRMFPNKLQYGSVVLTLYTDEVYVQFSEESFDIIEAYAEKYGWYLSKRILYHLDPLPPINLGLTGGVIGTQ